MFSKILEYMPTWQMVVQAGVTLAIPIVLTKTFAAIDKETEVEGDGQRRKKEANSRAK
ncbi:hypothetical protein [Bacillus massilinigeriensis]|uniref:hypothetical protein n=1 Tax=Bacillus mediterraneensis TaxID=1805474 RepID=UPI00135648FD|nr:hypothetical protein [Bacillus mediterraneensis]